MGVHLSFFEIVIEAFLFIADFATDEQAELAPRHCRGGNKCEVMVRVGPRANPYKS